MKISKKILLVSSVFLLLAAACAKQAAQRPAPSPAPQAPQQAATTPAPAGPGQKPLTVYENVQGSTINKTSYLVDVGVNAFDLLKATHVVVAKDYGSSMGMFVQSIDGLAADSKHFWEFFVNGKSSSVGVSSYVLKNGDKIEWKLSVIK